MSIKKEDKQLTIKEILEKYKEYEFYIDDIAISEGRLGKRVVISADMERQGEEDELI